jgi:hypothetical protein
MNVCSEQRLSKVESYLNQNFNQINSIQHIINLMNTIIQQQQNIDLKLNQLEMRIITLENTTNYLRNKYNLH